MEDYSSQLSAFMATSALIYFTSPRAARVGLLDRPSDRKQHEGEIPLVGGIAIFLGFCLALFASRTQPPSFFGFAIPGLFLLLWGVIDDLRALHWRSRFAVQVVAGLMMTLWGGEVISSLGALVFTDTALTLGLLSVPFTIICVVGMINAINMSDGIDGLAGALTLVAIGGYLLVAGFSGGYARSFHALLLLALSVLAFMAFNMGLPWRKRAVVFLGNGGSMFLGFALTWFAVHLSQGEHAAMTPVTALWLIALPFYDMTATMLRRIWKGCSPFVGDREHLHHAFLLGGFSPIHVVMILSGLAILLAGIGLGGFYLEVAENVMFMGFLALFSLYFLWIRNIWTTQRILGRSICRRCESGVRRSGRDRRVGAVMIYNGQERRFNMERRCGATDRRTAALRRSLFSPRALGDTPKNLGTSTRNREKNT
ncbi:MAG: undecaprenyl/decaprenyl-phosphate alpha-N-acetylglucosaminyl 1-phosphate transferase [Gammaproteobacteria bacterium]